MITIRPATANDANELQRLLKELASGLGQADDLTSKAENLAAIALTKVPGFHAHIAIDETTDQAVGMVFFFAEYSTWRGEAGVYIQDLYVDKNQRGSGLGVRLLKAAAKTGQQWHAKHLRLAVDFDNPLGRKFYERVGFKEQPQYCITQLTGSSFMTLLEADV
ncbi:GNAT family N-acetyltransferase [Pseudidiomarina marina]|uniref:GNAT family N-acetyltransferase n=1 Tax=Pseudidiomarina marina TaxID=502366 RepID=UPI00384C2009